MSLRLTLPAALLALTLVGCATTPASNEPIVVRTVAPRNQVASITNYFDARARAGDPPRELVIGGAQRGTCPLGVGNTGGYVGWVVPVEVRTRSSDSAVVTVQSYFFWFSDEVIRGVTRRMEVCP